MKQKIKKISIFTFILMLLLTIPINSEAFVGGVLIDPIEDFLIIVGDSILNVLQKVFLPDENLAVKYEESDMMENAGFLESVAATMANLPGIRWLNDQIYDEDTLELLDSYKAVAVMNIKYGPATIFFGNIELFNINFIKEPKQYKRVVDNRERCVDIKEKDVVVDREEFKKRVSDYLTEYHFYSDINGKAYGTGEPNSITVYKWERNDKSYELMYLYTDNSAEIIINEITYRDGELTDQSKLRMVISKVYFIIRNIVIVLFVIILVYIGIKILISSTSAQDKAKYKQMLKDWLVGLCLVFLLHIIMFGILELSEQIINAFKGNLISADGQDVLFTNIRFQITCSQNTTRIGYIVIYFVLIMYTIMFSIQYLKRLIYVIFLTIIAPFVALTYPLDKLKDGKAQAFNMWLKEYIYNVMIQILHVVLYYLLLSMAIDLATTNMIYSLVAIGFMLQAEKILKAMFGFEAKGGIFGGKPSSALAGALAMGAISTITGKPGKFIERELISRKNKEKNDDKIRTRDEGKNTSDLLGANNTFNDEHNYNQEQDNKIEDENSKERDNKIEDENAKEQDNKIENENEKERDNKMKQFFNSDTLNNKEQASPYKTKRKIRMPRGVKGGFAVGKHIVGKGTKFVAKTGLKIAGAATLGTIGVAAGLASDDSSNILKYGLGAAGSGVRLANLVTNKQSPPSKRNT